MAYFTLCQKLEPNSLYFLPTLNKVGSYSAENFAMI